jgi:hypothetical protein
MFTNSFALDSFSVIPNRRISQAQNASSRAQHASEIQTPKVSWNWIITSQFWYEHNYAQIPSDGIESDLKPTRNFDIICILGWFKSSEMDTESFQRR